MDVRAADFVLFPVKDMAVAQAFYRDTIGLTPLSESDGWSEYDLGNVTLSIVQSEDMPPGGAVALAVNDVAAALKELKAAGMTVITEPNESPVCHFASVLDPDGNSLWIHQRKDGTTG
jgi:predicted enzyme related to lactoylglutathione lyase